MQGRARQKPDEEPAVTFELQEAPRPERGSRLGAAGSLAVTGAGLASGGAAPDVSDSLDVFDQRVDVDAAGEVDAPGSIPTTSFEELVDASPELPALDFRVPEPPADAGPSVELLHGAAGAVGGGFRLDDPSGQEAFGAPIPAVELADDSLVDAQDEDSDALLDEAEADDLG